MSYEFRPSVTEPINKAPLMAIAGPTGCGKTESAMRLARGFVGPGKKFCIIDTEERRALYKKARYQPWDHLDLKAPYTPERYAEALEVARAQGYGAVIVDSWSHCWNGEGGVSDDAEAELEKIVDRVGLKAAEKMAGLAWSKPKQRIKRIVSRVIIRYPALLIFCLRSEPKIKYVKIEGKTTVVDAGFVPICEKSFMFDMLIACKMESLEMDGKPGVPIHIKELEQELLPVFLPGEQISEKTGERLAAYAGAAASGSASSATPAATAGEYLNPADRKRLLAIARAGGHDDHLVGQWLKEKHGIPSSDKIPRRLFRELCERLESPTALTADLLAPETGEGG